MQINITGLDKAKVLVALYNNAKNSKWTHLTIGSEMCPDPAVLKIWTLDKSKTSSSLLLSPR